MNPLVTFSAQHFAAQQRLMFGTPTPAQSNRYHRGLFHTQSHGQRRQRCFSMKYSLQTMKPNVHRKSLYSNVLGQAFKVYISTKARKCIIKAGSFDNYLINTSTKYIDSRFGMYLKSLVEMKRRNPKFEVPYIPGSASLPKSRTKQNWEYRHQPAIYMPVNVKLSDHSEFYLKTPQEMSRHEILDLERELKALDDPEALTKQEDQYLKTNEDGEVINTHPKFLELQR
jgi:ribosomal protein L28